MISTHVINLYYENDARKLRKIVDKILKSYPNIYLKDYDEFYSVANDVFADLVKKDGFDKDEGSFEGYLYVALRNAISDEYKTMTRQKRKHHVLNEYGELVPVDDISMDEEIDDSDGGSLHDVIASDYSLDKELIKAGVIKDENVEKYLKSLPKDVREVIELKMDGLSVEEIRDKLGISEKVYNRYIKTAQQNENIILFNKKKRNGGHKKMVTEKIATDDMDMMDLDTTDSYRMDKLPLSILLESINEGDINRKYILQRKMLQWPPEMVNRYLTRVLNNQPIPEIVLCEQRIRDVLKVRWLIDGLQRLSYAEAFKENRIAIGKNGAEFSKIQYIEYAYDDNGNPKLDEMGVAKYEVKVFDVVGKKYKDLPDFLKKRFNNYNVNVTTFFNCTDEQIAYHLRNYNNHQAMTKAQYGIAKIDGKTARSLKSISDNHEFFRDYGKFESKKKKDGSLERTVAECIMSINYIEDWKRNPEPLFQYLNDNATENDYAVLESYLDRLCCVIDKDVKNMFNTTNSPVLLAVFDKFTKLDIDDRKFVEFLKEFNETLHVKEIDGSAYDDIPRSSKDKSVVKRKIELMEMLMLEFLGIEMEETIDEFVMTDESQQYVEDFCSRYIVETSIDEQSCVRTAMRTYLMLRDEQDLSDTGIQKILSEGFDSEVARDIIDYYLESLSVHVLEVDNTSPVFCEEMIPGLVKMVKFTYEDEVTDEQFAEWLKVFVKTFDPTVIKHDCYENYDFMLNDLRKRGFYGKKTA